MGLSLYLDDGFFRAMADRFPKAAFSCLSGAGVRTPPASPSEWLGSLPSRTSAEVERALVSQLGGPWTGLEAQPPIRRAALVALAAYAAGHDVGSLLADLNMWAVVRSAGGNSCDPWILVSADHVLAASPVIAAAAVAHRWDCTVAAAIVRAAKTSNGVLPNGHYLWLASFDRPLWLILDGYGRREPVVENLGVVVHERAEIVMRRPLDTPVMIDAAADVMAACSAKT